MTTKAERAELIARRDRTMETPDVLNCGNALAAVAHSYRQAYDQGRLRQWGNMAHAVIDLMTCDAAPAKPTRVDEDGNAMENAQ